MLTICHKLLCLLKGYGLHSLLAPGDSFLFSFTRHLCAVAGTSIGCFHSLDILFWHLLELFPVLICRSFFFFFFLKCHFCDCVRIRISPSGQCTAVNEDGSTSHGDDEAIKEIAVEQRKLSAQRLALGKLTGTLHDKVLDAYLWLMRQGKGKNIKADKVCLNSFAALQHSWRINLFWKLCQCSRLDIGTRFTELRKVSREGAHWDTLTMVVETLKFRHIGSVHGLPFNGVIPPACTTMCRVRDFPEDTSISLLNLIWFLVACSIQEILSTYHDSFLYGEVPLTIKVRTSIRGWPLRNYLMWVRACSLPSSCLQCDF